MILGISCDNHEVIILVQKTTINWQFISLAYTGWMIVHLHLGHRYEASNQLLDSGFL